MRVITIEEIREVLPRLDPFAAMEAAFSSYSEGQAVVGPVGELLFETPPGDVHIKYGYLKGDDYYVVKVASGFYDNPKLGLPSSNGLMLLFDQKTGAGLAVLLDEGYLTDIRTAAAGAVAARHLAPKPVERIGIVGSGVQARLQLVYLAGIVACTDVLAWGRGEAQLESFAADMEDRGFTVDTTRNAAEILRDCNLVVTTTPSTEPLLHVADLRPGTHITAVGSDTPHKQELESAILARADVIVADSIEQCRYRGEIHRAIEAGAIPRENVTELGQVILGQPGRTSDEQITVADLTGVAVQDIQIAEAVYRACLDSSA